MGNMKSINYIITSMEREKRREITETDIKHEL